MIRLPLNRIIPPALAVAVILNGVANLIIGILPIFRTHITSDLSQYTQFVEIAPIVHASSILSIFLGLLLIALGSGLYKRKRTAWTWTVTVSSIACLNSLYPIFSPITFILAIIFIILMILFRHQFYIRNADPLNYEHLIAGFSMLFSLGYGIVGSYVLRDEFRGIHNLIDAVYYTLVTYSTLGYGDIIPITTNGKVFTCSMIIIGISSFVATLTIVVGPLIEKRMQGVFNIMNRLTTMKSHVIICGYNLMSIHIAKSLANKDTDCIFIERDANTAQTIKQQGYHVIIGQPGSENDLSIANAEEAKAIICAHLNDAENILETMAAQKFKTAPNRKFPLKIVTRIDREENLEKAVKAGADSVVSPAVFGGELMAKEALK